MARDSRSHQRCVLARLGVLLLAGLAACAEDGAPEPGRCAFADERTALADTLCAWVEHAGNPLIPPPPGEMLIADPTLLLPEEAPDGRWHLFANGLFGIYDHLSDDGLAWQRQPTRLFGVFAKRPFLFRDGDTYYLFYEEFSDVGENSTLVVRATQDLVRWGDAQTLLRPELDWEREGSATVGNPYVTKRGGQYWLYYSAGGVWLDDLGFREPLHIGVAHADAILGPYVKRDAPLLGPAAGDPLRNRGAGSLKLLDDEVGGQWIALENGIYADAEGRSRSAIAVLSSPDGLAWRDVCVAVAPRAGSWTAGLVYAFDTVRVGDALWMYFNARNGWLYDSATQTGTESIGLATLQLPCR